MESLPDSLPTLETASGSPVYEVIRNDIIEGRLRPNERLKVSDLADRLGTSTNPVREALHQLRGEGFVVMEPNRGARVRAIDDSFVRDVCEIEAVIEPYLLRWFIEIATEQDLARLAEIQDEIERLNFADPAAQSVLDTRFHTLMYERHYNRHALELFWRHRRILSAISRRFTFSLSRRAAIIAEHRELLESLAQQDAERAAKVLEKHVRGSGRHIIDQLRGQRGVSPDREGTAETPGG
jgi:DNA-binding GntR family transcriptional regulator